MWSFASNAIASIGLNKTSRESSKNSLNCSDDDDDICSNVTQEEEGLDCPICWESFNIVENIPYVLWCGHTLCHNCVLGLQSAVFKLPTQQIKIPFFISCPWCHNFSPRLLYKGTLKFPRKNFFLLWMVEGLNGNRPKFGSSSKRTATSRHHGRLESHSGRNRTRNAERRNFSIQETLDFFINFTSKFPLVIVFLLILFFIIPGSAIVLFLYFLVTVIFAIPSFLVLYFAYPALEWLLKEITS
ncbi:hypothetical protein ACFE04_024541 [Oxalis oulophora]